MKLLEALTQTPGVPGREDRVRDLIADHIRKNKLADQVSVDAMGSLHAVKKPTGTGGGNKGSKSGGKGAKKPVRVMLAAHMDQIGFLVSHIAEDGTLRISPVGGFDNRNLFARRVRVCTKDGDLPGVMNPGGKPVHIASADDRKKIPEISEFYVDLGVGVDDVKKQVKIGDMVVLDGPFGVVGDYVVSQCLDNRVGCWAVLKTLEKLKSHTCEVHAVFTVQEEVGLRGAGPAAYEVEPDIGISCDTTLCCKTPGVPPEMAITEPGAGVCLKVADGSTIPDIKLVEELEALATKKKIKHQRGLLPRGGQDGAMIQRSRRGVRTLVFACPVKNIHTVTEMSHKDDLESYPALLAAYLSQL